MDSDAVISQCGKYRYSLTRIWDKGKRNAMFIGLNPSTADATQDDNTIRRCINYAKKWGYGGLIVGNLFAYRATKPVDLRKTSDPIGSDNDRWLKKLRQQAKIVIAAWGNEGKYLDRDREILKMIPNLNYLKLSKLGVPCHPLYLSKELRPTRLSVQFHDQVT